MSADCNQGTSFVAFSKFCLHAHLLWTLFHLVEWSVCCCMVSFETQASPALFWNRIGILYQEALCLVKYSLFKFSALAHSILRHGCQCLLAGCCGFLYFSSFSAFFWAFNCQELEAIQIHSALTSGFESWQSAFSSLLLCGSAVVASEVKDGKDSPSQLFMPLQG